MTDNQGSATRSDTTTQAIRAARSDAKPRLLGSETWQKLLAFASLILLLTYFSFASSAFMQTSNMISILLATALSGALAIASAYASTLMTFSAVMAGVFLTHWGLPMWTGVIAAIRDRRLERRHLGDSGRQAATSRSISRLTSPEKSWKAFRITFHQTAISSPCAPSRR
jgi:hypothetical protein